MGIRTPGSTEYEYGEYYSTLANGEVDANRTSIIPVNITISMDNYTDGSILSGYINIFNAGFYYTNDYTINLIQESSSSSTITGNNIFSDQTVDPLETPSMLIGSIPSGGDGTYTYQWYRKRSNNTYWAALGNATSQNYQPFASEISTKYKRKVTSNGLTDFSNVVTITVQNSNPIYNNSISATSTSTPTSLIGTIPTGGNGEFSYQWQVITHGGRGRFIDISNATNPSLTIDSQLYTYEQYRRKVVSGNSVSYSNTIGISGSSSSTSISSLEVSPNPSKGQVNLSIKNYRKGKDLVTLNVFDASNGILVKQLNLSDKVFEEKINIDLSALKNGIYILKLVGKNNELTKKVIVQH